MTIKDLRLAAGLTQDAFADRIYVSTSTVRNWEQGRSSISEASAYTLFSIALISNMTEIQELHDLVRDTDKAFFLK